MFSYVAYGLSLRSPLHLPELVARESEADVVIRLGKVDRSRSKAVVEGNCFRACADEACLIWEEVGTLLVRGGREIIIDPAPGVEESVLRLFILGPALAMLLHQCGRAVLHASAVAMDGGAVAFLGGPGWGKSTMAAALYARGYGIVADDVIAVDLDGEKCPTVFAGFPQLKLWPDVAGALGDNPERLPRLRPDLEKRAYFVPQGCPPASLALKRLYVLEEGPIEEIEALELQEAFRELIRHTYGVRLVSRISGPAHLQQCATLARSVPLRRLKRPRSLHRLPDLTRMVEEDLAHPAGGVA